MKIMISLFFKAVVVLSLIAVLFNPAVIMVKKMQLEMVAEEK